MLNSEPQIWLYGSFEFWGNKEEVKVWCASINWKLYEYN